MRLKMLRKMVFHTGFLFAGFVPEDPGLYIGSKRSLSLLRAILPPILALYTTNSPLSRDGGKGHCSSVPRETELITHHYGKQKNEGKKRAACCPVVHVNANTGQDSQTIRPRG